MEVKMIHKIDNMFTQKELFEIEECILKLSDNAENDKDLGRLKIQLNNLSPKIERKIRDIAIDLFGKTYSSPSTTYVEYSNKYGQPNLPAHFDSDNNDLVFDYQLKSNTNWDFGVGTNIYPLTDNSCVVFNANEHIHWRPNKEFKDGEYLKMIFFRLSDINNRKDYSHMDYKIGDPIFDEVNAYKKEIEERNSTID